MAQNVNTRIAPDGVFLQIKSESSTKHGKVELKPAHVRSYLKAFSFCGYFAAEDMRELYAFMLLSPIELINQEIGPSVGAWLCLFV